MSFDPKRNGLVLVDADGLPHNIFDNLFFEGAHKTKARALDPLRLYTPAEVAHILAVSYDTAVRRMRLMKACTIKQSQCLLSVHLPDAPRAPQKLSLSVRRRHSALLNFQQTGRHIRLSI